MTNKITKKQHDQACVEYDKALDQEQSCLRNVVYHVTLVNMAQTKLLEQSRFSTTRFYDENDVPRFACVVNKLVEATDLLREAVKVKNGSWYKAMTLGMTLQKQERE